MLSAKTILLAVRPDSIDLIGVLRNFPKVSQFVENPSGSVDIGKTSLYSRGSTAAKLKDLAWF